MKLNNLKMELILERKELNTKTSIGNLTFNYLNTNYSFYTLEDKDRNLNSGMPLQDIQSIKIKGETAIPKGTYQVIWSFSNRFQRFMPELLNVPGFSGIRIHAGNTEEDTDGCILLGKSKTKTSILSSKVAVKEFETVLLKIMKKEKVFITIK